MATWLFLTSMRPGCHVLGHWYNSSELFQMLPRCFKLQNISLFPPPFYQIENFRQRWRQRPGGCRPTCWSKRDTHSTSTSTWPAWSTCPTCPARPRNLILKPGTGTCWTQCLRWAKLGLWFSTNHTNSLFQFKDPQGAPLKRFIHDTTKIQKNYYSLAEVRSKHKNKDFKRVPRF